MASSKKTTGKRKTRFLKKEDRILALSEQDSILFMKVLMNPPLINENLKKAFNEFSENLEG